MPHGLGALGALAENLGPISSIHSVAQNHLYLQFWGPDTMLTSLDTQQKYSTQIYIGRQNDCTNTNQHTGRQNDRTNTNQHIIPILKTNCLKKITRAIYTLPFSSHQIQPGKS